MLSLTLYIKHKNLELGFILNTWPKNFRVTCSAHTGTVVPIVMSWDISLKNTAMKKHAILH